jgi:hypothetical protein
VRGDTITVGAANRAPLLVFAAVFLFIGGIFFFIGVGILREDRRYQAGGRAEAVVTDKGMRRATDTSDTAYHASYRLVLADGTPFQTTEEIPVDLWERIERNTRLQVEYVNSQPPTARIIDDRSQDRALAVGATALGGALALVGVGVLAATFRRSRGDGAPPAVQLPQDTHPVFRARLETSFWPSARRAPTFWIGAIFLVVGLPFFVVGAFLFYDDWAFSRESRLTTGMVLTKEIKRSNRRSSSTSRRYEAAYRFTANGQALEGRDQLPFAEWQRLVEREPVAVLYRPSKPSSNHLAARRAWLVKTIFGLLGSFCAALGGVFFVRAVRHAKLEWRLRQHGTRTEGRVADLGPRDVYVNNVRLWRLQFEYSDYQGRSHLKTFDVSEDEAQAWKVGDPGAVLYDTARPTDAVWLGRES